MPRLNGLQLFNTIKTLSPDTKILFCSALDTAKELVSILHDANYDCIIRKPVEREYFIRKVNSAPNNSTIHFESLEHDVTNRAILFILEVSIVLRLIY